MCKICSTWRWTDFSSLSRLRWSTSADLLLFWAEGHWVSSRVGFHGLLSEVENGVKPCRICKTFWSIQTQLICSIEDFKLVFAGNWTLMLCERNHLSVMDLELRLLAWILIPNNGKRLSLKGTRKKNPSSPERIGFHSVATVWFSFHWLFWLLRKKRFQHGWEFCQFLDFKCDWNFFPSSTLKSDVNGWFIFFSYHIVLNLYFVKWIF